MEYKPDIREKVLKLGIEYPLDEELIMLILGSGTSQMPIAQMARKIIQTIDSCNPHEIVERLLRIKGIGKSKALAVAAALELGRRRNAHLKSQIRTPEDIVPFVQHYAIHSQEHFIVAALNGCHEIVCIHLVSIGTVNRTLVHPREVFTEAIRVKATSIILCHNHPSGNLIPSDEDIETTELLLEVSDIVGIDILDHIIFDCNNYFSFLENKILFSQDD